MRVVGAVADGKMLYLPNSGMIYRIVCMYSYVDHSVRLWEGLHLAVKII